MSNKYLAIFLCLLLCVVLCAISVAQEEERHAETKAEVPALADFHEVIYQLWHTAWPERDIAMLVELLPGIEAHNSKLVEAELPGILRDKQSVWEKNLAELQYIIEEYKVATSPVDTVGLLDAAERLHAQYEKLVRTIRPVLKEVDEFHAVLYMLYHHYMPDKDRKKIAASAGELQEKVALLKKATLPKRLQAKQEEFAAACTKLAASVNAFKAIASSREMKLIDEKVEAVHSDYQALEKVFE
jgi:hypothetical protein